MIRYLLRVRCSTADCVNSDNSSELWYDNPTVSHPCGICGMMITDCVILKQSEFQAPPPPPVPILQEVIEKADNE